MRPTAIFSASKTFARVACEFGLLTSSLCLVFALASGCRVSTVEICDSGDVCARACAVDADCPEGECVGGLCQDALPIDPNDGSAGIVTVVPGVTIDMGTPDVGAESVRTITLVNEGRGPFTLQGVDRDNGTGVEYEATPLQSLPALIGAGESLDVVFRWTRVAGPVNPAFFLMRTNAGACSFGCDDPTAFYVELRSGSNGGDDANLQISPPSYDFGVNAPGTNDDTTTFQLRNAGADAVTIESISTTGDVNAFDVSTPATPFLIAGGGSQSLTVRYVAAADGTHALSLVATAAGPATEGASAEATITGQVGAVAPAVVADPTALTFAISTVGASQTQTVALRNTGPTSATVTNLAVDGAGAPAFSVGAIPLPLVLDAGQTASLDVTFTAQTLQSVTANLNVTVTGQPTVTVGLAAVADDVVAGPNLDVVVSPQTIFTTECGCQATPGVSAANIDVIYRSTSAASECTKPANPSCGVGGECPCPQMNPFGTVTWGSARVENVRGSQWIIDEQIRHRGAGDDGTFTVRVHLADDCLAVPGSLSPGVNHACCEIDCNPEFNEDAPQACFDYPQFPSCASFCDGEVAALSSTDCFERGPIAVRTIVRFSGGTTTYDRHFCSTLAQAGSSMDIVDVVRSGGLFQLAGVKAGVVEVDPSVACD